MSEPEPEPSLIPPDEPPELPWTDWKVAAWIAVEARTAEEAEQRIERVVRYINGTLDEERLLAIYRPIVQRADDDPPRSA